MIIWTNPFLGWGQSRPGQQYGTLGLTLAAITGKLIAEGLAGRTPSVDLAP